MSLDDLARLSAQLMPQRLAITSPHHRFTYKELDALANRFAHALKAQGVQRKDRIGLWLEKSAYVIAAMQGILRLGAIYVPLDPLSPATRIYTIIEDCGIHILLTTMSRADEIRHLTSSPPCFLFLDHEEREQNWLLAFPDTPDHTLRSDDQDIAYILYTSGSTGKPKGVCITHRNALAFIRWAASMLEATAEDRFANHAPFHFDLSVMDLYVAFAVGATVFLIPDGTAYIPRRLVEYIVRHRLTIWYSVPSALLLMMEQGGLLEADLPSLRAILFAGEPFPIKHLRTLHRRFSESIRFFNLYGPTETNVCTYYEVIHLPEDHAYTVPIGKACSGDAVWAQKEDGSRAQVGETGELVVTGPSVMQGYWGEAEQGNSPYFTGDLVRLQQDGNYVYLGRRDLMMKVRGFRIEPGEIEATLYEHQAVKEVAVLGTGSGLEARLVAFVVLAPGQQLSLLEVKRYCAARLPRSMIVDQLLVVPHLPRTRNGKIDRLTLSTFLANSNKEENVCNKPKSSQN